MIKITEDLIKQHIEKSFQNGSIEIKSHRNIILVLEDGVFKVNNVEQPKSKASITSIFLEALRLTRYIKLDDQEYIRKGSKWIEK